MTIQREGRSSRKNQKKTGKNKRDIVNISIDRNSIRLDVGAKISRDFWGKRQHRIYIGLPDTPDNRAKAEEIKSILKRDILWGEVDTTDERYKIFSELKTEQILPTGETLPSLLEMYDEYCEKKRLTLAVTTYKTNYQGNYRVLFEKIMDINPNVDIQDSVQILELSKRVTKSQSYSRIILYRCRDIVDSLITTGKLPPNTVNPYNARLFKEVPSPPSKQKSKKMEAKGYIADSDTRAFTMEELKAILEGLKHVGRPKGRWYSYISFLIFTGCRPGEASGLLWRDIDESLETLTFRRSWDCCLKILKPLKTEKPGDDPVLRVFPCSTELKELLKNIKPEKSNPNDFVFSYKGKPIDSRDLGDVWLGKAKKNIKGLIEKLIEEGKVKQYLKPYALRHSFITLQLAKGQAPADVAYWVGNSPAVIYGKYVSRQPTARPAEVLGQSSRNPVEPQPQSESELKEMVLRLLAENAKQAEEIEQLKKQVETPYKLGAV